MLLFGFDTFLTHDRSVGLKRNSGRGDGIRSADPQFEFGTEDKCNQLREERYLSVRFLRSVSTPQPTLLLSSTSSCLCYYEIQILLLCLIICMTLQ